MRVVTLASGVDYVTMARETARVNRNALGFDVDVVSFDGDPFESKLDYLARVDADTLLVDADVVIRKWDWSRIDAAAINALRAPYRSSENYHKRLFPDPYVLLHTGLVYMPARLRDAAALGLELMRGELRDVPYRCHDEVPFSAAVCRAQAPFNVLPSRTMRITNHTALDAVDAIHFFDGTSAAKLARVREYVKRNNL